MGRFIQADTIVPDPADPQSLNRFSYTRNNPLRFVDPTGHADELGEGGAYLYQLMANPATPGDLFTPSQQAYIREHARYPTAGDWLGLGAIGVAIVAGPEIASAAPAIAEGLVKWATTHVVAAKVVKSAAEEVGEAALTGTPVNPANIALDFLTEVGDDLLKRAFRSDQDRFLRKNEEGLSVFIGVSDEKISEHLNGVIRTVPRTTVNELGLTTEKTPGQFPSLDPYHYEIRPGAGMGRKEFKECLKQIPWR